MLKSGPPEVIEVILISVNQNTSNLRASCIAIHFSFPIHKESQTNATTFWFLQAQRLQYNLQHKHIYHPLAESIVTTNKVSLSFESVSY
jgi:hypothetical protein